MVASRFKKGGLRMSRFKIGIVALGATIGILTATSVGAWERGPVDVLAVLPDVTQNVQSSAEGLTVGPDGNIYVTTFGFNTHGALTGNSVLIVISPSGNIVRKVDIQGSSPHTLGLAFNPVFGNLLVLDFGAGTVLDVNPHSGLSTVKAGPFANSGLNALTFDSAGNAYVSDSFNGVIWKVPHSGPATTWASDPLLGPGTGLTPPFGANGVEFNNDHSILYVANTAFHQIIQIPVNHDGTAGKASILITGINAPDGIAVDNKGNIWVCANQQDEIDVIDKTGKVIAKRGDFRGIDQNGIAQGLLFPASLAFSQDKRTLYLPYAAATLAIDSPYPLQFKGYTVSKMPALIPPFPDRFH